MRCFNFRVWYSVVMADLAVRYTPERHISVGREVAGGRGGGQSLRSVGRGSLTVGLRWPACGGGSAGSSSSEETGTVVAFEASIYSL